jgi:hypothetical protein
MYLNRIIIIIFYKKIIILLFQLIQLLYKLKYFRAYKKIFKNLLCGFDKK